MSVQPFYDYYETLQISPNADFDAIEKMYRLLAKKYHPDNHSTGDAEKFASLTTAYKMLSDTERRAAYDASYQDSKNQQWKSISEAFASDGYVSDQHVRRMILSILYTQRRRDPANSSVGVVQLENIMQWPGETLDFHIWYLKQKKLIERSEAGGFEITAEGVDKIECDGLILRKDRLLTESTATASSEDGNVVFLIEPSKRPIASTSRDRQKAQASSQAVSFQDAESDR